MPVRVFEDDEMIARAFLKKGIVKYYEGNSTIKPRNESLMAGQSEFKSWTAAEQESKKDKEDQVSPTKLHVSKIVRLKRAVKSLSPRKRKKEGELKVPQSTGKEMKNGF